MRSLLLLVAVLLPYSTGYEVGQSEGFLLASDYLSKAVDKEIDPCVDFYNFTCGKWRDLELPKGKTSYKWMYAIEDRIIGQFKDLLENPTPYKSRAMNMMKSIYRSCVYSDSLKKSRNAEFLANLKRFGGFPVLAGRDWDDSKFDLTQLMIDTAEAEPDAFFYVSVKEDEKNVSSNSITVEQKSPYPIFETYAEAYLDPSRSHQVEAVRKFIIDKLTLLKGDSLNQGECIDLDLIKADVEEFIRLEITLAKAMVGAPERNDFMKLSELAEFLPQINWHAYFRGVSPPTVHEYLASNPTIMIGVPEFLKRLGPILATTPKRTLANYVLWKYTKSWILKRQLDGRYDQVDEAYSEITFVRFFPRSRWQHCISVVNHRNFLKHISSAIYVREHFSAESKADFTAMYHRIKAVLRGMMLESDWMMPVTRARAIEKLDVMGAEIAYPEMARNDTALDYFYRDVRVSEADSYPTMVAKVQHWDWTRRFEKLVKEPEMNDQDFRFNAGFVNGAFTQTKNRIAFPVGFILEPSYHLGFPAAMKYAGAGYILGHEITHGFDTNGANFDKHGNRHDWWDPFTKQRFNERAQCFVEQYSRYEVPGTGRFTDGKRTLPENIADNGAMTEVFLAYKNYLAEIGGEEPRIPGFGEYNNEQMFFIAHGHSYCMQTTLGDALGRLNSAHPDDRVRINGATRNSKDFARAFNCPTGSPMSPPDEERCRVW